MPGDVEGGIESVGCKHAGGDEQNGDLVGHELDQARLVGRDHGPRPWSQGCVASRVSVRCTPVQFGHDLSLLGLDDVARPLQLDQTIPKSRAVDLRQRRKRPHQRRHSEATTRLGCGVGWLAHDRHFATRV